MSPSRRNRSRPLVIEAARAELRLQVVLQLPVGVRPRGEADRRAFAHRMHQRAGLLGRNAPVADQLPFQPFAHPRRSVARPVRRAVRAAGSRARGSARCPRKSWITRRHGGLREPRRRHSRPAASPPRPARCRPAPPRPSRTAAARPATASAYCMALVDATRTRSSSLSTGLCSRIGPAISIRSAASCRATSAGSSALAATVARQRLPHLDRKVADQKPRARHRRPARSLPVQSLVELPAELGRDLRPCMGGAVALEGVDIGRARDVARAPGPHGAAASPRACRPPTATAAVPAHPCPTIPPARNYRTGWQPNTAGLRQR